MLFVCAAFPVQAADTPVSPAEFEALVQGKTLSYSANGVQYGAEDYYGNRQVRWSFMDGHCSEGQWFAQGPQICFVYEDIKVPQCWEFFLRDGQLQAQFDGITAAEQYEVAQMAEPLVCLGPAVGV